MISVNDMRDRLLHREKTQIYRAKNIFYFGFKSNFKILMNENELSNKIIGLAIDVHKHLGPDLLESAYKECLYYKICNAGIYVEEERPIPLIFEGIKLDCGYGIDLMFLD